jgi:hypothetical protein
MSVAHDPANPNSLQNITGNFSLDVNGTVNGDSGVNLVFGLLKEEGPASIVCCKLQRFFSHLIKENYKY